MPKSQVKSQVSKPQSQDKSRVSSPNEQVGSSLMNELNFKLNFLSEYTSIKIWKTSEQEILNFLKISFK